MVEAEHIYNPKDDSLAERIRAYRVVHKVYLETEYSLKIVEDDKWPEVLGNREEVISAHAVSISSLYIATNAIRKEEIATAQEQGLLNEEEAVEIVNRCRRIKMQDVRQTKKYDDESSRGNKRR